MKTKTENSMAAKRGELNESEKELFDFINKGLINDAKRLLKQKDVRVDCLDESGMTPLQQAAYRGNKSLCRLLLARGADVNSCFHTSGYTALMFAALSGSLEVTRLLLEAGAIVDVSNSVGRNACQMAAFVGQHEVVSLINNFFSKHDLEYYTKPQGLETEPKLPAHLATNVHKLILNNNMKTVKICLFLQEHEEMLECSGKLYKFFEVLCERMMKQKCTNEVMAMKFHYYGCTIKKCHETKETLDAWIKALVRWDENGFEMEQEKFIRSVYREFPYMENQLIQQMVRQLAPVKPGDSPSALDVLDQVINGQHMPSDTGKPCATCGDNNAEKKCSKCKYHHYCNQKCQKLHWFTHKKWCAKLAEKQRKIEEHKKLMEEQEKLEKLKLKEEEENASSTEAESEDIQDMPDESEPDSKDGESVSDRSEGNVPLEKGDGIEDRGDSVKHSADVDDNIPVYGRTGPHGETPDTAENVRELVLKGTTYLSEKKNKEAIQCFQKAIEMDSSCTEAVNGYREAFMHDLIDPDEIRTRAKHSRGVQDILQKPGMRRKLEEMQRDPEKLREYIQQEEGMSDELQRLLEYALIDQ